MELGRGGAVQEGQDRQHCSEPRQTPRFWTCPVPATLQTSSPMPVLPRGLGLSTSRLKAPWLFMQSPGRRLGAQHPEL